MGTPYCTAPSGMRGLLVTLVAAAMLLPACGGDDTAATTTEPATVATTTTTTPPSTTTTSTTTTTAAPTTTTPAPTTTTTTGVPSAADSLADFFAAARGLDSEIRATADVFNSGFDPDTGTLSDDARYAVFAFGGKLDVVAAHIPAGLSLDLETAVLAAYADLNSRVHALRGAEGRLPKEPSEDMSIELAMECLRNGSVSAARFPDDLAKAEAMAPSHPVPNVAPDSDPAGVLAVRIEAIDMMNSGCDACGGVAYDAAIPVDWEAGIMGDGVEFEATFVDNGSWWISVMAC